VAFRPTRSRGARRALACRGSPRRPPLPPSPGS
jgi:hypothetical protein